MPDRSAHPSPRNPSTDRRLARIERQLNWVIRVLVAIYNRLASEPTDAAAIAAATAKLELSADQLENEVEKQSQ